MVESHAICRRVVAVHRGRGHDRRPRHAPRAHGRSRRPARAHVARTKPTGASSLRRYPSGDSRSAQARRPLCRDGHRQLTDDESPAATRYGSSRTTSIRTDRHLQAAEAASTWPDWTAARAPRRPHFDDLQRQPGRHGENAATRSQQRRGNAFGDAEPDLAGAPVLQELELRASRLEAREDVVRVGEQHGSRLGEVIAPGPRWRSTRRASSTCSRWASCDDTADCT